MKLRLLLACAVGVAGPVEMAAARPEPNPPPSGIVIHLFGPGPLVTQGAPGEPPPNPETPTVSHVAVPPPTRPMGGAGNIQPAPPSAGSIPPPALPASPAGAEPGWGPVLHQMFVTGDPNEKPGQALSTGRAHDRPR